jgi:hypothetical protein
MLIFRILSAIAAMAMGAAVVLVLPGVSPDADASTPTSVVKSDRLDIHPMGKDCTQKAWPYYEASCLRNLTQGANGPARPVRMITVDRLAVR